MPLRVIDMNEVYIIRFKTTNEVYETTVCANIETAHSILKNRGFDSFITGGLNWWEYQMAKDNSQTAEIVHHNVFDFFPEGISQ